MFKVFGSIHRETFSQGLHGPFRCILVKVSLALFCTFSRHSEKPSSCREGFLYDPVSRVPGEISKA